MELREEQVQMIKKDDDDEEEAEEDEEEEEEKTGFSFFGHIWRNHCGPMSGETEGKSRCETSYQNRHTEN